MSNLAMYPEKTSPLGASLKDDAGLKEHCQGAAAIDAAVEMAQEAGSDVSSLDQLRHEARHDLELEDDDLEGVAGGLQREGEWWGLESL